jgi:hypothetical protein
MHSPLISWLAVVLSAFVASTVNAIAGGGTFLTFPTLTGIAGLSEKVANMTSTVGLWPGAASSIGPAMPELRRLPRSMLIAYSIISLIGGTIGSLLLLMTNDRDFRLVIPWLLAFATIVFGFSAPIARWAGRHHGHRTLGWTIIVGLIQFFIAVYGGYFGAGIGVLMLAGLSFSGLDDVHHMNAMKVYLGTIINGVACVIFIAFSLRGAESLDWTYGPSMAVAAVIGGVVGMRLARWFPRRILRAVILSIGVVLSAVYFWKAYG